VLAADIERGVAAASAIVGAAGLDVDDVVVLNDSNAVTVRLRPCDVVARIDHRGRGVAGFDVEVARRLAEVGAPVAALEPRVGPQPHERDGFVISFWTFYESGQPEPAEIAAALGQLHAAMRALDDLAAPHFTDRVAQAQRIVADPHHSPELADADRALLGTLLRDLRRKIGDRRAPEQLLHGEPHPLNLLGTGSDLRFIDLETCCRGPIEHDLAYVPEAVRQCYPDVDRDLLGHNDGLVLAMVAAWRWDAGDQLPGGRQAGLDLLAALRAGPPWPLIVDMMPTPS
jgi:hypothetical protein